MKNLPTTGQLRLLWQLVLLRACGQIYPYFLPENPPAICFSILSLCCSVCRFAVQVQTLAFAHPDKSTQRASIRLAGYALLIKIHTQSQSTPDAFTYTMFAHIVFR